MTKTRVSPRLVAWIAVTIAVAVVAYLVGVGHSGSSTITAIGPGIADASQSGGTAYVGAGEPLNQQPYGFAYSIPPGVEWSDSSGGLHEGDQPPCLPFAKAVRVKNIEAVQFTVPGGASTGTVLWVQC